MATERLIGVKEDFLCGLVFDQEPMEAAEGQSDVLPAFSAGENLGRSDLDILKPVYSLVRNHRYGAITVVQVGSCEGVNEFLCHRVSERRRESGGVLETE